MIREIEGVSRLKDRNRSQRKRSEDVTIDLEDRGRDKKRKQMDSKI